MSELEMINRLNRGVGCLVSSIMVRGGLYDEEPDLALAIIRSAEEAAEHLAKGETKKCIASLAHAISLTTYVSMAAETGDAIVEGSERLDGPLSNLGFIYVDLLGLR